MDSGPFTGRGVESERDSAESWSCTCGQKISATKKRCWSCFKWRGGVKGSTKSKNACARDVFLPKPKKSRLQKSKVSSDGSSIRQHHNRKTDPARPRKYKDESPLRRHNVSALNSSTTSRLDILKVRTTAECAKRWGAILMANDHRKALDYADKHDSRSTDPFDCSELVVLPNVELLEREVEMATQRWEDLDSRIVLEDDGSIGLCDGVSCGSPIVVDRTLVGDGRRQRLLPLSFDYKCERIPCGHTGGGSAADSVDEEFEQHHYYRPRVISLSDPTQTLDYETELWHVFHSMPTASDLERRYALLENKCENQPVDVVPLGCQHTLQVKRELNALLSKHTRMDAHSLGRIRVRDRHSIPRSLISQLPTRDPCLRFGRQYCETKSCPETSIRFEILRHSVNLKRGSGRDSNRLEVELSGSRHTLLDLHRLLVECAITADGRSARYKNESEHVCDSAPSGVFFIENSFYTHGVIGEHVGRTILQWLSVHQTDDITNESGIMMKQATVSSRQNHLGLASSCDSTPMSKIYLESLPLRLGIRYVHMFIDNSSSQLDKASLCSESTLFVTDIHTNPCLSSYKQETHEHLKNAVLISHAPIIHDAWTPLKQIPSCSACNSAAATVVMMNDELTDLSSTVTLANAVSKSSTSHQVEFQGVLLCACCFRALHYAESVGNHVLRPSSRHMTFRALPVDVFNKLSYAMAADKVPKSAIF
ncbi:hypothetical protein HJC23_012875 [Cyclotella cryptica]|uniref:Uncharacterized protein n=1 Tax=Cyclotella cryptica TaxID=29204 RepID=A0ABD3Q168_9STRA